MENIEDSHARVAKLIAEKNAAIAHKKHVQSGLWWAAAIVVLALLVIGALVALLSGGAQFQDEIRAGFTLVFLLVSVALTCGVIWFVFMCIRIPFNVNRMCSLAEQKAKAD